MLLHLLISSVLLALQPVGLLAFPGGDGWEWISRAMEMEGAEFMGFAHPLVEMSANAYRYPAHPLQSIPGWSLSSRVSPLHPSHGGAHALVFEEISEPDRLAHGAARALVCEEISESDHHVHGATPAFVHEEISVSDPNAHIKIPKSHHHAHTQKPYHHTDPWPAAPSMDMASPKRLVIAFRGTQISTSIDSLADLCADKLLWEGLDFDSLPPECSVFEPYTLDYFIQALNYTLQVIGVYPAVPILLTGHSLGAGLAILVSGALSQGHALPVIGFGAPATRKPLLDRGLSVQHDSIVVIAHEWDVIVRSQMEGQVGLLCFYPQEESLACKKCLSSMRKTPYEEKKQGLLSREALETWQGEQDVSDSMQYSSKGRLDLVPEGHCMECFLQTHYLKNLIALVSQGAKPSCH